MPGTMSQSRRESAPNEGTRIFSICQPAVSKDNHHSLKLGPATHQEIVHSRQVEVVKVSQSCIRLVWVPVGAALCGTEDVLPIAKQGLSGLPYLRPIEVSRDNS